MMWQILKPHYLMLDRKLRAVNRYVIILVLAVLLFVGEWLYKLLLGGSLAALTSDAILINLLLAGLAGAVLLMLLDISHILYQLFETPELEILTVNPVPYHDIYALKLLQSGRAMLLPGLYLAGLLIFAGVERGASPVFYPAILVTLLSLLILIAAGMMSLVLLVSRLIPPKRLRSGIYLIFTFLPLLFVLLQLNTSLQFSAQLEILATQIMNPLLLMLIMLAVSGLVVFLAFQVFTHTFQEGRTRYQTVYASRERRRGKQSTRWLVKEWSSLRRDTRQLVGFSQPLMFIALLLLPRLRGSEIAAGFQVIVFWLALLLSAQLIVVMPNLAVDLLVREGRNIGLLRTQPINAAMVMKVKLWAVWLPQALIWGLCIVALAIAYSFAVWQAVFIWVTCVLGLIGSQLSALGLAAECADFNAERVPRGASLVIVGISVFWAAVVSTSAMWIVWHGLPKNDVSVIFSALNINLASQLWLILPVLLLALLALAHHLWRRGSRRLSQWEVTM